MRLYLVTRIDKVSYDEYDSFVCAANSKDEAVRLHPQADDNVYWNDDTDEWWDQRGPIVYDSWTSLTNLTVQELGITLTYPEPQIILASYNAG